MSKVEDLAKKYCEGSSFEDACMEKPAYIAGYHQAEKDIKEELSKLFQEFTLDCINDDKDIHILHFITVFKNKLKEIGNE